ncbi:MAG: phage tail protein [Lysinibacillus sp.]
MAKIGSFGDLVFEVSENKTKTFSNFQRTTKSRWESHNLLSHKPELEFEGAGTDDISFTIVFRADFGVNPEKEMAKLREFISRGKKPISPNYWVIEKAVESHKSIDHHGNILSMEVQLSLLEYPKRVEQTSKKKTTAAVKNSSEKSSKKTLGTMSITVKSVHIRSGPGVNNKVVGYAMKGDKLTVYSVKDGWYSLGGGKYITASSAYSTLKKG